MFPVIYDFGDIDIFGFSFHPVINSYGFMLMLAFYSCYFFLNKDLKRLGHNPSLAGDIIFAAAVGGIVGSRVYFLLENFDQFISDPIGMIFSGGGLVFLGGLLGGLLAVTYVIKVMLLEELDAYWLEMITVYQRMFRGELSFQMEYRLLHIVFFRRDTPGLI